MSIVSAIAYGVRYLGVECSVSKRYETAFPHARVADGYKC